MKAPHHPGRLPAALTLSAALHAGLVAWLATREPSPRAEAERFEVRLVDVEGPVVTATPASRPRGTARKTATATATPTSTSTPTSTPTSTSTNGETPLPGSAEWLASRGLAPAEGKGVSLALPWRGGGAVGLGAPSATEHLPGEPPEVLAKRNVDGWLHDLIAVEKAVRHPDGYWSDLRKRLAKGFTPGWEILTGTRQEVGLFSRGQLRALAEFWKGYEEQAARYGATGNAYGAEEGAPGTRRSLADDVRNLSILPDDGGVLGATRPESRIFHRELVALIRIRQEPDVSFDAHFVPTDLSYPLKKNARSEVELKAVY